MQISDIDLLSLIGRDSKLKRAAATNGGEWQGPCPRCGGKDRLRVQPSGRPDRGQWFCRQCSPEWGDAIDYIRFREACDYPTALEILNLDPSETTESKPREPEAPAACVPPTWHGAAGAWCEEREIAMWDTMRPNALAWLHKRGFSAKTLTEAGIGANQQDDEVHILDWGVEVDPEDRREFKSTIWLPRGIVFPWLFDGQIWKINIRTPDIDQERTGRPKYMTVRGSSNALYNADSLRSGKPAILVEGVLDALAIQQEAGDMVAPVAAGTTGARHLFWYLQVQQAPCLLVAFDNDQAGDTASQHWLDVFSGTSMRWAPYLKDAAEMLEKRVSIRAWVETALETWYSL